MGFSRFFKTPGHKQFDYIPRHWDPKKEDLEKRLEIAKNKNSKDLNSMKARISSGMRRGGHGAGKQGRSSYIFRSNLLLLGIIIILVAVTYLLFVQYLPYFLDSMGLEPAPVNQ